MTAGVVPLTEGWQCAGLPAGAVADPAGLAALGGPAALAADGAWVEAQVPGTAAGALRSAGRPIHRDELDGLDWWYRCRTVVPPGQHRLAFGGIATLADVWIDGRHVLSSDNMHRARSVDVAGEGKPVDVVVRCAALDGALAQRRPRPRWKTPLVAHQQLRYLRTSLLGRIPGWAVVPPAVGLWRPVELRRADGSVPDGVALHAACDPSGPGGAVRARFELPGGTAAGCGAAQLSVGTATASLAASETRGGVVLEGSVAVPHVERWWPHTHGRQPLYEVWATVGERRHRLGRVGFRTVEADRDDGGFRVRVNGQPIFCRGACWLPPDPVTLATASEVERHRLDLAKTAGMNMLRVPGTTVYETPRFFDSCDELGILVWQDCMFAFMDPPTDDAFTAEVEQEIGEAFGRLGGHPSVAVVCGNQEVDEVAAMYGLDAERRATPLFEKTLAELSAAVLPGVPYVASNPTGGDVPFRMGSGVSQYFGVGGYLRPVEDARRAGVRFAAECLAFATPPEPISVEEAWGGAWRAGHDPVWKEGVHHDAGRSWDMEDVRDHYVATLFGTDPLAERYTDAERALELGRATNAALMEAVLTEWRRPGSSCDGALVLALCDLRHGAGWGLVDAAGRPKAPWYALARVLQPVALLAVDEGLNGLLLHVVNDRPEPLRGLLRVELVSRGEMVTEDGEAIVTVRPHSTHSVSAEEVIGAWRDVTYAYRFAPPAHDAVVATLCAADNTGEPGAVLAQAVHLPLGQRRPMEADLGLGAGVVRRGGQWAVEVATRRLAQWVTVRVPGYTPSDSWFHLPPGGRRTVALWPEPGHPAGEDAGTTPRGVVQALNGAGPVPITGGAG